MPRIFLKPNSPEYAEEEKISSSPRRCDMPGCRDGGGHRAPKNRALSEYYWFCQEHAREYNQAWNYFAGMSDREVEDQIISSHYGDRPTWRYDVEGSAEDALKRAAWKTYNFTEEEPKARQPVNGSTPEGEALAIMGLEPPITLEGIKARYKELAKKHHPDLNGGCAKSEEILKSVNMAYTILKVAYEKYRDLEDPAS